MLMCQPDPLSRKFVEQRLCASKRRKLRTLEFERATPSTAAACTVTRPRAGVTTDSEETAMPQFDATIKHIKDGVKSMTVSAAVKNIEGWEATLEKLDAPGAKTIVKDLENLKKHLHAKELDGEAIRKLVTKLGKETVSLAGKSDSKNAEKAKALGEALSHAAETEEAEAK